MSDIVEQFEECARCGWARTLSPKAIRAATIEECAQVADSYANNGQGHTVQATAKWIGDDIRALKERS